MRVFISGSSKSGKSFYAQTIAKKMQPNHGSLYYLATMVPVDREDLKRIEKHQQERAGWGFETIEISKNIMAHLKTCDRSGPFLLDSITTLLANKMFLHDGQVVIDAAIGLSNELVTFVQQLKHVVLVSDNIYSDACVYDELTEAYRRGLALIDRQLANICDTVLEVCCGQVITHKGNPL